MNGFFRVALSLVRAGLVILAGPVAMVILAGVAHAADVVPSGVSAGDVIVGASGAGLGGVLIHITGRATTALSAWEGLAKLIAAHVKRSAAHSERIETALDEVLAYLSPKQNTLGERMATLEEQLRRVLDMENTPPRQRPVITRER